MKEEVRKEYAELSKKIGETINEETLKKGVQAALAKLIREGMPKEFIERMLKSARPMGDFGWFQARMGFDEFNEFFGGTVRKYGLDGSLDLPYGAYGASTTPEILNISPYGTSIDTYEHMRGKPIKKDPDRDEIFYAGHMIEPIYRAYFRRMFGERYIVFDCDIQWHSRKYPHFVGNCDGLLYDKLEDKFGILEIKHTSQNNARTIHDVKTENTPKYWDMQQRDYMELLDADFSCLFLGWGNRPGLDTNAMVRIERDKDFGESILEQCEEFMIENVEAGVKPSLKNVKSPTRVKAAIEEMYGPINPRANKVKLDKALLPTLEAIEAAMQEVDIAKAKEKLAQKEVDEAQEALEALTLPIIEELKNAPEGYYDDGKKHYEISYDIKQAINPDKVKLLYPDVFDLYKKESVDTTALKKGRPDVYKECRERKVNGKRSFDMRIWRSK